MAGPSVLVRILGDVKGFLGSAEETGNAGETAGKKIHAAFSSMLSTINRTGVLGPFGDALAGIDASLAGLEGHATTIGEKLLGAGGALVGIGVGLQSIGSKEQEATNQLATAIQNAGGSYGDYADRIAAAVKSQEKYGNTAVDTKGALEALTQATNDPAKALQLLSTASDLAATKHEDLKTAATTVGKAFNGNTKSLKAYGITTKDGQTAVTELGQKLSGEAAAGADSFNGKVRALRASVEDSASTFANKFGPAITTGGAVMTGAGAAMEILTALNGKFEIATKLAAAGQWLLNLAIEANPIMIAVLALAAITAAVILLYEKCDWFRNGVNAMGRDALAAFNGIKAAVVAVFDWIKTNWPLLLGILTGPYGLAVVEIIKHRDAIVDMFKALPGMIANALGSAGTFLVQKGEQFIDGLLHGAESAADGLVRFVEGIPGRIAGALGNLANLLYAAGRAVISGLGRGIEDALKGVLSDAAGIADKIKSLKGPLPQDRKLLQPEGAAIIEGLGRGIRNAMPSLANTLSMVTGSITGAASPSLPGAASPGGPLVHIESATFSDGADIDLLLQRVGAAAMAGRL